MAATSFASLLSERRMLLDLLPMLLDLLPMLLDRLPCRYKLPATPACSRAPQPQPSHFIAPRSRPLRPPAYARAPLRAASAHAACRVFAADALGAFDFSLVAAHSRFSLCAERALVI